MSHTNQSYLCKQRRSNKADPISNTQGQIWYNLGVSGFHGGTIPANTGSFYSRSVCANLAASQRSSKRLFALSCTSANITPGIQMFETLETKLEPTDANILPLVTEAPRWLMLPASILGAGTNHVFIVFFWQIYLWYKWISRHKKRWYTYVLCSILVWLLYFWPIFCC